MELLGRSLSEAERDHLQLEAALKERELATAELQKCVTNVEALMADETSELRGLTARHHSLEMDLQRILQHQVGPPRWRWITDLKSVEGEECAIWLVYRMMPGPCGDDMHSLHLSASVFTVT